MSESVLNKTEINGASIPITTGIPEGWDATPLGELAIVNEKTIDKTFAFDEIEYIDIAAVDRGRILEIRKIRRDEAPSRAQRICRNNDILLSTVRPNLKHFAFIKDARPNTIASTGFAVISAKQLEPRYLYYYLTTDKYTNYLSAIADGHTSTYPAFNPDVLENSTIPIPPVDQQRAIAKILSDLDEKIELNHRMNKTLEAIAQAIFKQRFVDNADTGKWVGGKVADLVTLSRDTISPNEFQDEPFDHYSIPAFDERRLPKAELGSEIQSNKSVVLPNVILLSKLNPRIPRVWLPDVNGDRRAICSTEFLVVIPKPCASREFLHCLFNSQEFLDKFSALVTGTSSSHQRVKPEYLLEIETIIPPSKLVSRFSDVARPLFRQVMENLEEARVLGRLRDSLLPKLMSGKLRVGV